MKCFYLIISLITPVLFFSCKKETDEIPPTIEVSSPTKNASFNTFDTILVNSFLKDDQGLKIATVELLDIDLNRVSSPITKTLNTQEFHLNVGLFIENIHLNSGKHYLLITASDENNTTKNFTQINVNGLPLITKGFMVFESNGNNVSLHNYFIDTNYVVWENTGPFKDGLIDNYYQQSGYLQGENGSFYAQPLNPFFDPWQLPPDQGGITFCRAQPDEIGIQVGYKNGILAIFIEEGNLRKTYHSEQTYFPALSLLNKENVIVWQVQESQLQNKIEVFFIGGTVRQISPFNPSIVDMVNKNIDEIYIGANENGDGQLLSYELENGLYESIYELPNEPIVALCKGEERVVYFSTAQGIYKYDEILGNPSTPLLLTDIPAINMEWDFVNDALILTTENKLIITDKFGNALQTWFLDGFPEDLHIWYSK